MYGYVPESIGGIAIHTLSQKTTFAPARLQSTPSLYLYPIMAGYSANFAMGKNYHLIQKGKFRGYYWPSALHFWFFTGAKIRKDFSNRMPAKGISAVMEIGTLEAYWMAYTRNDSIRLGDILSMALALQVHF